MNYDERIELYRALAQVERGKLWRAFNRLGLRWSGSAFPLTGPEMDGVLARPLAFRDRDIGVLCSGRSMAELLATAISIALERLIQHREEMRCELVDVSSELGIRYEPLGDVDVLEWSELAASHP